MRNLRSDREKIPMLQIMSGKYFRDVELRETPRRRVLYSNVHASPKTELIFPLGRLLPSDDFRPVTAWVLETVEKHEAVELDGSARMMIATSGDELVDDIAVVLSFTLNATFDSNHERVQTLLSKPKIGTGLGSAADIVTRIADPMVFLKSHEIEDLRQFFDGLIALNRSSYLKTMKAIRQVVSACSRSADDPTSAYTMLVAAIESLSGDVVPGSQLWGALDSRKRKVVDEALDGLPSADVDRIRDAILVAEHAGATRRFIAFVEQNVAPDYFREKASDALRPLPKPRLLAAVKRAYGLRSKNIHALEQLPLEAWGFAGRAESSQINGAGEAITIEGLNRLARYLIRAFVSNSPTEDTEPFTYHDFVPSTVLSMQLAPPMWIGQAWNSGAVHAERVGWGFIDVLTEFLAATPRSEDVGKASPRSFPVDMRDVLRTGPDWIGSAEPRPRSAYFSLFWLWHELLPDEFHIPASETFMSQHAAEFARPSLFSFVVSVLLNKSSSWPLDELIGLAEEAAEAKPQPIERSEEVFTACLFFELACRLQASGRTDEAVERMALSIEAAPGSRALIEAEQEVQTGSHPTISVRELALAIYREVELRGRRPPG
jgi:hypothetical protein